MGPLSQALSLNASNVPQVGALETPKAAVCGVECCIAGVKIYSCLAYVDDAFTKHRYK